MYPGSPPYFYNEENVAVSKITPSTVHIANTRAAKYFKRYLLQKAISVFKWELPEYWSKDYFLYCLYCFGFVAIVNTDKYGVIPQQCGLQGYDVFYRPTNAIISNPLIRGIIQPRIGVACELIKLQPDYGSIMDIVNYYGDMLALCSESVEMNLLNSHLSYVFGAKNKSAAESFKKLFDKVSSGEVCAVVDKDLYNEDGSVAWQAFQQNLNQNYIADKVLNDMRTIVNMFDTEIGIPNANTQKKERMIVDEVNSNNIETYSKVGMWLEELKNSCKKVNKMFNLNISVDWRENNEVDNVNIGID